MGFAPKSAWSFFAVAASLQYWNQTEARVAANASTSALPPEPVPPVISTFLGCSAVFIVVACFALSLWRVGRGSIINYWEDCKVSQAFVQRKFNTTACRLSRGRRAGAERPHFLGSVIDELDDAELLAVGVEFGGDFHLAAAIIVTTAPFQSQVAGSSFRDARGL